MLIFAENWNEFLAEIAVAPFVGAWIETIDNQKHSHHNEVAPFVGAWIETIDNQKHYHHNEVAPFVGAWIETAHTS